MSASTDGTSAERLFLEIRFGILRGDYLPGETFDRNEVSEAFGVSQRVVSNAMATLLAEGYVEFHRRAGYRVKCWSRDEVDDMYDLRASFEGLAAARAAKRATDAEIECLLAMVEDTSGMSFVLPEDIENVTLQGIAFHVEVLKMSKIPSIGEMARNVVPNALHRRIVWSQHIQDAHETTRMHGKIASDIAARSEVRARNRMREDIYAGREIVLEAVEELARRARPGEKANLVRYGDPVVVKGRKFDIGGREMGSDGLVTPIGVMHA